MLRLTAGLLALACVAAAQRRVDPRNTYEPAICVVSVVGTGTMKDPKRPQYAPWPPTGAKSPNGIIAFSHQVSDDGTFALVEFVARDRSAFQQILADKSLKVFDRKKDKKDDIEKELKKYKHDFDISKFGTVMP